MDDKKMLLKEWEDIRETLRYFGNKRFAQLTVFIAINGFMFSSFLSQSGPQYSHLKFGLTLVGASLGILFLLMEISSVMLCKLFDGRGVEIENHPDVNTLGTFKKKQSTKRLKGRYFTFGIYLVSIVLWIIVSFIPNNAVSETTEIVKKAIIEMPVLDSDSQSKWKLVSLIYDRNNDSYDIQLMKMSTSETWSITINLEGRIVKASRNKP